MNEVQMNEAQLRALAAWRLGRLVQARQLPFTLPVGLEERIRAWQRRQNEGGELDRATCFDDSDEDLAIALEVLVGSALVADEERCGLVGLDSGELFTVAEYAAQEPVREALAQMLGKTQMLGKRKKASSS
jgi:hypothetical protein